MSERPEPTPCYVTCRCQHCDGGIEFDASEFQKDETRNVECPHCHLETELFVPEIPLIKPSKPAPPQDVGVEVRRGISPLGIAALVLGTLSCLFCWIPLPGFLALSIAFIGLLLAIAGMIVAGINKKTGFGFPISGGIVCILSVFIALATAGGLSKAVSSATTRAKHTNQESQPSKPGEAIEKWSKSLSITQGDMKVTVNEVRIGPVHGNDALGQPEATKDEVLTIDLAVANLSQTKTTDFQTWRGTAIAIGGGYANLTDNYGNTCKRINITPRMKDGRPNPDTASIAPLNEQHDIVVFELPAGNIQWLHFELPAENFGGDGVLRFQIPSSKIFHQTI
jgi:hypothetical protein